MAKSKSKCYDEGGVTEGQNTGIGDDTRARAMKYIQEQSDSAETEESTPAAKTTTKATKIAKTESKAEAKADARDAEAGKSRGRPAEGEPKMTKGERPMVTLNGIPTRRLKDNETLADVSAAAERRSKEPVGPNSASGSALGRNIKNTLMAMGPTRLAGLGNAAAEGAMASRAAKAVAAREAKTLNPSAWMAGPKGMKENFKSGGGVKGWGIARGSRTAKTY
jgi:hypothetical protein